MAHVRAQRAHRSVDAAKMLLWDAMPPGPTGPGKRVGSNGANPNAPPRAVPVHSSRALSGWLLAYALALFAVSTLSPFTFSWPDRPALNTTLTADDALLNLLMLVPAGFLYRAIRSQAGAGSLETFVLGLLASTVVESLQLGIPGRNPSPYDVGFNTVGAVAGAQLYDRIVPIRRQLRLAALHHPLGPLAALLTAQMLLASLGVHHHAGRIWLLSPLVGCAVVVVVMRAGHPPGAGRGGQYSTWSPLATPGGAAAGAGAWVLAACLPTLGRFAPQALTMVGASVVLTFALSRASAGRKPHSAVRAYQVAALGIALYLAALMCRSWTGKGLTQTHPAKHDAYALVECLAGFCALGYLIAQGKQSPPEGRKGPGTLLALALPLGSCLGLASALEAQRNHGLGIPILELLFAALGATIFLLSLEDPPHSLTHEVTSSADVSEKPPTISHRPPHIREAATVLVVGGGEHALGWRSTHKGNFRRPQAPAGDLPERGTGRDRPGPDRG